MAEQIKVEYSVDFDDEWLQEDCHWKYDRFFILTWKVWSGPITNINTGEVSPGISYVDGAKRKLYYWVGDNNRVRITSYKTAINNTAEWGEGLIRKLETFTYRLNLSSIDIDKLLAARTPEGWLPITLYTEITDVYDNIHKFDEFTFSDYYLELPPKSLTNIKTDLITDNPGELICSWDKPKVYNDNIDDLNGYCIELLYKPTDSEEVKLSNLAWNKEELNNGKYKLTKISNTVPDSVIPEGEEVVSLIGQGATSEVYIENPGHTNFYFTPKELGIKPGDSYKFIIYPYAEFEGARLTNDGSGREGKVSKGVVRVRTSSGWVEGQVWVCTEKGWTMAESIYTKTAAGWKEAI